MQPFFDNNILLYISHLVVLFSSYIPIILIGIPNSGIPKTSILTTDLM